MHSSSWNNYLALIILGLQGLVLVHCLCDKTRIGCIGQYLVKSEFTYLVEFQPKDDPLLCQKTCQAVHPKTSLVLLKFDKLTGLECHCALASAVRPHDLGPEVLCNNSDCGQLIKSCGGSYTFANGTKVDFVSVYCQSEDDVMLLDRAADKATTEDPKKVEEDVRDILKQIWFTLSKANIVSIIIISLLIILIILLLILLVWTYLFLDHYQSESRSQFYRQLTGPRHRKDGSPMAQPSTSYGATNQAFDPHSEATSPGIFVHGASPDPPSQQQQQQQDSSDSPHSAAEEVGPDPTLGPGRTKSGLTTFYYGMGSSSQESVQTEPADGAFHADK